MKYCQFSGFICDEKSQRKDHQKTKHRPYFALAKKLPIQLEKKYKYVLQNDEFSHNFSKSNSLYIFPVYFSRIFFL